MRIRNKPKKPVRKEIHDTFYVFLEDSIAIDGVSDSIMGQVRQALNDKNYYYHRAGITESTYKEFRLEKEQSYDCDYYEWHVVGIRDETDKEFNERLNSYKRRLNEYNKWLKENEAKIEAELLRREKAAKKKEKIEKERIKKEIARLQKKLKDA